jgi:GMP synthase (glutamine-hydrolysing)
MKVQTEVPVDHFPGPMTEAPEVRGPAPTVLAIQNSPSGGPRLFGDWLSAAGIRIDLVEAYAGATVPARMEAHGLLVLGGAPSPREDDIAPWFPAVRDLLAAAVADRVPTLGICLGHQLLAIACGGDAGPTREEVEVGLHDVTVDRTAAEGEPLFGPLPAVVPAVESHKDEVWELPPGAVPLASTPGCRYQAFRVGPCAWGVQFHPEVTARRYVDWAERGSPLIAASGNDPAELEAECVEAAPKLVATWRPFAWRFAQVVRKHARAVAPAAR